MGIARQAYFPRGSHCPGAPARKPRTAFATENRCAPQAFACMALRTVMVVLRPCGLVAQWLEPTAHNGLVGGSSPSRPTTNSTATCNFHDLHGLAELSGGCEAGWLEAGLFRGCCRRNLVEFASCLSGGFWRFHVSTASATRDRFASGERPVR